MDSLTQVVLGAACGELVAGKKLGNKALLLGALGGTLPDLDVFVGWILYDTEISRLTFHRGFMHSILFAVLASMVLGAVFYYFQKNKKADHSMSLQRWTSMWFLSIFTHPILDAFTPYGTQLFNPFLDTRVAFNTIAVVDVFYTLPFIYCLVRVILSKKNVQKRALWVKRGLLISTAYLALTCINKIYIDHTFAQAFEEQGIAYKRFTTQPSLFTNFLWYGCAEDRQAFHSAYFSIFDDEKPKEFIKTHKNFALREKLAQDNTLKCLKWFSKDFYHITEQKTDSTFRFHDLRYPLLETPSGEHVSVFGFTLSPTSKGLEMQPFEPKIEDGYAQKLWKRTWGMDE